MKYKIGDKVRVIENVRGHASYRMLNSEEHDIMTLPMSERGGDIVVITGYSKGKYVVDGDNLCHWTDEMFSELILDETKTVKNNNKKDETFPKEMLDNMGIKKVIFNKNATIVYLENGVKGIAKRSNKDVIDPQVGLAVAYAIAKGTNGNKKQMKSNCDYLNKKGKFVV